MGIPDWKAASEQVVGFDHPLLANTKDRCGQTIQSMIEEEHTIDGIHNARTTGLVGEINTFVGNGAVRIISLSNSGLIPKKVFGWEARTTTELVTNGGFSTDTGSWAPTDCTIASVAGGESGNCCELTRTGGGQQYFKQTISFITGKKYKITLYVKSGTSGDEAGYFGPDFGALATFTTTSSWVQHEFIFTGSSSITGITIGKNTITAGTMLFDTISVKEAASNITRIDLMTSEKAQVSRYYTNNWEVDKIDNFQAGSFDIGAYPCNTTGETNYYLVLGIDTNTIPVGDVGAGSDPNWITSSTLNRIIADDSAVVSSDNIANNVESEIWTQFIEEHTIDGIHSITLQHEHIETITWTGNNSDDRIISCNITDLDIMDIEVYKDGSPVYSKSMDISGDNTKQENVAAFVADLIQDITINGQFTIGTGLNLSGGIYVACLIGM